MTGSQKKKLFEIISSHELDWTQFAVTSIDGAKDEHISKISHSVTEMYFQFSYNPDYEGKIMGPWKITHTPGANFKPIESHLSFINSWKEVEKIFIDWLLLLKLELESQSFFNQIISSKLNFNGFFYANYLIDEEFSEPEKTVIKKELENFKLSIGRLHSVESDIYEINEKVNYLIDRLDKNFSKVDWTNIFISTIISTMFNEGLQIVKTPEFIYLTKSLFHFLTRGLYLN
jgi:hypothetical protein